MTGFEVAGVVLAVIPLIISALEHYKEGQGVASSVLKWRGHLDTLIFRLKLQKTLFYLQAMELLREAGVAEIADAVDLTEEDCVRLLQDAKTGNDVKEYLGYLYLTFEEIIGQYEICLKSVASKLGHIKRPPHAKKDDLCAIIEANASSKGGVAFKERLTFTIERASLKKLVDEIQEDRLSLKAVIKGMKTQHRYDPVEPSQDARKLAIFATRVQSYAKSLHVALQKGWTCSCRGEHSVMMHLHNRVAIQKDKPKKLKKVEDSILFEMFFRVEGEGEIAPRYGLWHQTLVHVLDDKTSIAKDLVPPMIDLSVAPNELPSFTFQITPPTLASTSPARKSCRVTNICHIIRQAQQEKKILLLRLAADGLEHDERSERPPQPEATIYNSTTSLEKFLDDTMHDEDSRMTPKQQTILALTVASSILQLHGTPWFVGPWTKRCIRFLIRSAKQSEIEINRPLVEQTMVYKDSNADGYASTPDPKIALLELAILLLEIWHHKTLETWMAKTGTLSVDTAESKRIAAIRWVEMSSERLPPYHLTAIEGCLAICSGRLRTWEEHEFRKLYCENIIKPLQESCKAW